MEVPKDEKPQDIDVVSLGFKLIEEAKSQAVASPLKNIMNGTEDYLNADAVMNVDD